MTDRMLTMRELCARKNKSPNTVYRMIAAGLLPAPERVGPRAVRFRESAIEEAYARLNAGRSQAVPTALPDQADPAEGVIEATAQWLADQKNPPSPVIAGLVERFGLTASQAVSVAARAFELRAAR